MDAHEVSPLMANDVRVLLELDRVVVNSVRYQQVEGPYNGPALGTVYVRKDVIVERAGGLTPKELAVTIHFPDAPDPDGRPI